jgi:hypothetical protein
MAMKLQDKLDAMREDFENGRFPLVPTRDQLETVQRATALAGAERNRVSFSG